VLGRVRNLGECHMAAVAGTGEKSWAVPRMLAEQVKRGGMRIRLGNAMTEKFQGHGFMIWII